MKALGKVGIPFALLIGATAGIAIGWGLGSWTTCAPEPGCEVRLDAVNTLAALIGGLGTFVTLLIGVIAFGHNRRVKARATILDAHRSAIRLKPVGLDIGCRTYSRVHIEVTNRTATDMMNVALVFDRGTESERTLRADHQLHRDRKFATSVSTDEVGLAPLTGDDHSARRIINERLKNRVAFLFDLDDWSFVREGNVVKSQ